MNNSTISEPALKLIAMIQAKDVLRQLDDHPDLLAMFIECAEIAVKMSADRGRLIAKATRDVDRERLIPLVTRVCDGEDRVLEAIARGNLVEVEREMRTSQQAFEILGAALKELPKSSPWWTDGISDSN
jgi:hypothetical protein